MKIFNTKTRKKENFKSLKSDKIKIYYCGPTVYNYAHIWNLKTFVFEDLVVRTFRFLWERVESTMNITDIDDKTIRDSIKSWESLKNFTQKYTKIFMQDLWKLNVIKADNVIPISTIIPEMARMINTMLRRWNAYLSHDGSIYFKVSTYKNYWKLANLDISNLKDWVRIDNDEYDKENFWDFVLWKAWKKEDWENFWLEDFEITKNSTDWKKEITNEKITIKWRPWWHIECSACAMKIFWPQIDIHMWWEDLIFPHHQNEIAQTESCTLKEFSKYWIHSGHILVDWKKMSKSLGNFYTLNDLENKFKTENKSILYRAIRLSFISWKYRDTMDFSLDKIKSNIKTIENIDNLIKNINLSIKDKQKTISTNIWVSREFSKTLQDFLKDFVSSMEDDFNTPEALAVFFSLNKFVNTNLQKDLFSFEELKSLLDFYKTFNEILAIIDFDLVNKYNKIDSKILKKLENRNNAKRKKNFELADSIRDELLKDGYKIIDDRNWARIEKI